MSGQPSISASEFAAKWKGSARSERAAAQEHFIDLCRLLGVPTPNEADPTGDWYAFEKGAQKQGGAEGFADVWKRGHFAWEYKGKRKNLEGAYKQLLDYREALENPPLLVVCDLERFEVHTNFTSSKKAVHAFTLDDLVNAPAEPLRILRALMKNPGALLPEKTREGVTEWAAQQFAQLAGRMQARGHDPHRVAHFLNKILFCLFAEDVELLPKKLFEHLVEKTLDKPAAFAAQLKALFVQMSSQGGGWFGSDRIEWFNGGLFNDSEVIELDRDELAIVLVAAQLDWSEVEPAILGTLFERGLDPKKRSQLGAHYTDRASILRVVEPVVLVPLRRELTAMKAEVQRLLGLKSRKKEASRVFRAFLDRLRGVTVLDPACGSGNFLYVTLQLLKDLEKEAIQWGSRALETSQEFPGVGPQVVHGIELNDYAAELARMTIWIGQIQWMIANGFSNPTNPVLQPLKSVENRDGILDLSDAEHPRPAQWPKAEFIVGNPPFLGGKRLRDELGDGYVEALFRAWEGTVPHESDLVCYWHEQARAMIEKKHSRRAGLLSTNSIRGGANRKVLERIKESGDIFAAWGDEDWIVDGAEVRVSIVAQDDGSERQRFLDGEPVDVIYADLTGGATGKADLTTKRRLQENVGLSFMGDTKGGAFDITREQARAMVIASGNPHGRPNIDVVRPWINGLDVTRRPRDMFIVDFGTMTENDAALYERPFKHVVDFVQPERAKNNRDVYRKKWWVHVEPRPAMLKALSSLGRFLVTTTVAKHRLFSWAAHPTVPDHRLYVFARTDDFFMGVLQSHVHERWSLATCSWQGVGNDPVYNNTACFETFPFPWPLNTPDDKLAPAQLAHRDAIAAAAKDLDDKRTRWLNPPELVREVPDLPLPPRLMAVDADAAKVLKQRTLTNLYNAKPQWLVHAHQRLDGAVLAAYGWAEDVQEEELLGRLLGLNRERAEEQAASGLDGPGQTISPPRPPRSPR